MTNESTLQTLDLPVSGMDCGGCVKSVEKALRALPGVADFQVSIEKSNAVVRIDPTKVSRDALVEAIEDAGFDVPR